MSMFAGPHVHQFFRAINVTSKPKSLSLTARPCLPACRQRDEVSLARVAHYSAYTAALASNVVFMRCSNVLVAASHVVHWRTEIKLCNNALGGE